MRLIKYDKFLEATLSLPLLRSERNGKQRGDKLVKKLEDPDPKLTLNTGEVVDIDPANAKKISTEITDNSGEYDNSRGIETFSKNNRYIDVIEDEESDEMYKLNQFKKDEEFGSSGAGVNTRSYENLQCIYLAHKLIRPNVELTPENIIRLLADYNEDGNAIANVLKLHLPNTDNIDEILVNALSNPDWATTLINVTNDLYNYKSRNMSIFKKNFSGKYHVYHISSKDDNSPFKLIANKFKSLLPKGVKIEFSKYCPADAIVSLDYIDIASKIADIKSIEKLTQLLNGLFTRRILIPISLKKVGFSKDETKTYSIIVNNELERPLPEFRIESFTIYHTAERGIGSKIKVNSSWKDAKGVVLDGEDRFITIDSSNTSNRVNVDGEVEGKFSRHGKISHSYMKNFINSVSANYDINEYTQLLNFTEDELILQINEIVQELDNLQSRNRKKIKIIYPMRKGTDVSTGRLIGNDNRKNKLISKLQSLQIVYAIAQIRVINPKDSDSIINKIMRYALSIEADGIVTPRYVRVI